ncbi:MAG: outer membrane beta-barrel protein [Bacteroidota bacterium]
MEEFNDKGKFEKEWSEAFEGAELGPSQGLWDKIESSLAQEESVVYKKRVVYYKWIAAASVIFALFAGGVALFQINNNNGVEQIARQQNTKEADQSVTELNESQEGQFSPQVTEDIRGRRVETKQDQTLLAAEDAEKSNSLTQIPNETQIEEQNTEKEKDTNRNGVVAPFDADNNRNAIADATSITHANSAVNESSNGSLTGKTSDIDKSSENNGSQTDLAAYDAIALVEEKDDQNRKASETNALSTGVKESYNNSIAAVGLLDNRYEALNPYELEDDVYMVGVPIYPAIFTVERSPRQLWAGLNMATGSFNPNINDVGATAAAAEFNASPVVSNLADPRMSFSENTDVEEQAVNSTERSGSSYAFGLNFGKQISSKWVLKGGVQYALQQAEGSSNAFAQNQVTNERTIIHPSKGTLKNARVSINTTDSYDLENTFEFVSIPLQAGYMVFEKNNLGLVVSSGVSTDILLQNTIADTEGQFVDESIRAGTDSPYKQFNFNGLVGTEIVYRLKKNYVFSFEPSYRISLNSFTKSDTDFISRPRTLQFGFGLKYIFD